jgi:hypothetical protein
METQAHDLHKSPGHGWKHYFFVFFMLFLALTPVFFVENIRGHFADTEHGIQYMKSFMKDLETDIRNILI